ncbi:MAG: hypothetical protein CMH54_06070 [Myxococcales bacterium]|nr:hypothetical protein [Myxococcales bacterium]
MSEKKATKKKTSKKNDDDAKKNASAIEHEKRDGDALPKPKVEVNYHVLQRKRRGETEKPPTSPSDAFRRLTSR